MKKFLKNAVLFASLAFLVFSNSEKIFANDGAYLLYETKKTQEISKDVTYQEIKQVTSLGLRDIYVLKVPTKDPNIKLNTSTSRDDFNLKQNVVKILNDNGAIAGVNGDFFNMNGTHSHAQGTNINSGEIISTDNFNNMTKNEYATFMLTDDGNPIIDYLKVDVDFINNGAEYIEVYYYNKYPQIAYPICIDQKAMSDTSPIDNKFPNVYKVVVTDNVITYISQKGETVKVPENGYVICFSDEYSEYFLTTVNVGEKCELNFKSSIDFDSIYTAIGGGGKIVQDGEVISDGGFVPTGRQPRTAIGVTKDKNYILLVVVDGRTHSIGASHYELGAILQRLGAYQALHLDGGGSTAMAVKGVGNDAVNVVNTPSQGSLRNVQNALGVYNNSTVSGLKNVKIEFRNEKLIAGLGNPYTVIGYDEYYNKVSLDGKSVSVTSTDANGSFKDGKFFPSKTGAIDFTVSVEEISSTAKKQVSKLLELIPNVPKIQGQVGDSVELSFSGKSDSGFTSYIYDAVNYEVVPSDLGNIENNKFTAAKEGSGYIKATLLDVVYYIKVSIGLKDALLTSFDDISAVSFLKYPEETINGKAYAAIEQIAHGTQSLALEYSFGVSDTTQAAYLKFNNNLRLAGNPAKLKLSVFGDNSNNILRVKLIDSKNAEHLVTLSDNINWTGFKELTANVPKEVSYPVSIERIYVASLSNTNTNKHVLYFDNLVGEIPVGADVEHPSSSSFYDTKKADLSQVGAEVSFTLVGDVTNNKAEKPDNYVASQETLLNALGKNSSLGLIAGDMDYDSASVSFPILRWGRYYGFFAQENFAVVYMNSGNTGNFYNANLEQWQNFRNDILASGKKHIIIETDINPYTRFTNKEYELFHNELVNLYESGINIFVISTEGQYTTTNVKDGIRYINMGGLFKSDNSVNNDVKVLRFKISGDEIFYNFENVF